MKNKDNKKVLILGASSDIGIEILKIYLRNNYFIIAHYSKGNQAFFDYVKKNKIRVKKTKFNFISNFRSIENFLKKKEHLTCDVIINALGYVEQTNYNKIKISDIERSFKVNLYPGIYLTSRVGEEMVKKKWGRIVNLGSIGVKFGGGMSNLPYSLSKFGLEFFPNNTKKWIKDNVFINTLRVGATDTKLHKSLPSKNLKNRTNLIPIKRMANPKEIAEFVFLIGSEKNTYISHQVIPVSGGE